MSNLHTAVPLAPTATPVAGPRRARRTIGRWLLSFAGYPLGGYAAFLLIGRVDSTGPALAGGLLTGAILGAIQPGPWEGPRLGRGPGSLPPPSAWPRA